MKISTIIPTYNGLHLLKKNLSAVLNCLRNDDELIIVDDASTDQTVEWLTKKFSTKNINNILTAQFPIKKSLTINVKILINSKNKRFAQSVNKGVNHASHDLIFLLNNDVSPAPDILEKIVPYFNSDNVFGVGLLEKEPVFNLSKNKKFILGGKNRLWFDKGLFFHSRASDFKSGETAWISGGSGIFDRKKWMELRGFDKRYYPAYWEDIDLSFRARKKGWKVLFDAEAIVHHNHESTNSSVFGQKNIDKMGWRNSDKFTWKNGDFWQKISFLIWRPYWIWKRYRAHL